MTANPHSMDLSSFVADNLERAEPDLLRSMLSTFIQALMGAEADAICGAPYGVCSPERTNSRNGYRTRDFDTRAVHRRGRDPEIPRGQLLPGVAAGTPQASPAGPGQRGRYQLPAGGVDPADGEAGRDAGHHPAV
jgi:hypothetical protein